MVAKTRKTGKSNFGVEETILSFGCAPRSMVTAALLLYRSLFPFFLQESFQTVRLSVISIPIIGITVKFYLTQLPKHRKLTVFATVLP